MAKLLGEMTLGEAVEVLAATEREAREKTADGFMDAMKGYGQQALDYGSKAVGHAGDFANKAVGQAGDFMKTHVPDEALRNTLYGAGAGALAGGLGGGALGMVDRKRRNPLTTALSGALAGAGVGGGISAAMNYGSEGMKGTPNVLAKAVNAENTANFRQQPWYSRILQTQTGDAPAGETLGTATADTMRNAFSNNKPSGKPIPSSTGPWSTENSGPFGVPHGFTTAVGSGAGLYGGGLLNKYRTTANQLEALPKGIDSYVKSLGKNPGPGVASPAGSPPTPETLDANAWSRSQNVVRNARGLETEANKPGWRTDPGRILSEGMNDKTYGADIRAILQRGQSDKMVNWKPTRMGNVARLGKGVLGGTAAGLLADYGINPAVQWGKDVMFGAENRTPGVYGTPNLVGHLLGR